MYIQEIQIYGYGKLERVTLTDLQPLTVFFGENEAGKSTLMSFIHSILFGFPSKVQSELRYEPKSGAPYGGKLIVQMEKQGTVAIERVAGKSGGTVVVTWENGTVGGEAELRLLLQQMDKSLYQSIFSFNLQGLQNIHQLKNDELGRFLFSTGAVGTDRILSVEQKLQKELEDRFKPSGRKPVINEKLNELKTLANDLKKAEAANEAYWPLRRNHDQSQEELLQLINEEQSLSQRLRRLEEWEKLEPLKKAYTEEISALKQLADVPFPIDGIRRYEELCVRLIPLEADKQTLLNRLNQVNEQLVTDRPNTLVLDKQMEIMDAIEKGPLIAAIKEEIKVIEQQLTDVQTNMDDAREKLHITLQDEALTDIDTSIFMKERVRVADKKQSRLKEKKDQLDERYERERLALERFEEKVSSLQKMLLSDQERVELEEAIFPNQTSSFDAEWSSLQQQKQFLRLNQEEAERRKKQSFIQGLLFSLIGIVITLWSLWQGPVAFSLLGIALMIYALYLYSHSRKNKQEMRWKEELSAIQVQEEQLKERKPSPGRDLEAIKRKLEKNKQHIEEHRLNQLKWNQHNELYEEVLAEYEQWEQEKLQNDSELAYLSDLLQLPKQKATNFIMEAFQLLELLKEEGRKKATLQQRLEKRQTDISGMKKHLMELGTLFLEPIPPFEQLAHQLRKLVQNEIQKEILYGEQQKKYVELTESLERLTNQIQMLNVEKNELFAMAQVTGEEEYRHNGQQAEKRDLCTKRAEELVKEMAFSTLSGEEVEEFQCLSSIEDEKKGMCDRLHWIRKRNKELQQSLADIRHQLTVLEDGGDYSERLHRFTLAQSELQHEAKQWAKFALARDVLRKTVNIFNHERLPAVLTQAEQYLQELTDGRYVKMVPNTSGNGFLVHRSDYTVFEANELSQATMEQVYVSLRLALIMTIYQKQRLPIIIDDSFVNFDAVRTAKVISLLKKMKNHQILFFTCHTHLLAQFEEHNIVELGAKPVHH